MLGTPAQIAKMEARTAVYYMAEALKERVGLDVAARTLRTAVEVGEMAGIKCWPLTQAWEKINNVGGDQAPAEVLKAAYSSALDQLKP